MARHAGARRLASGRARHRPTAKTGRARRRPARPARAARRAHRRPCHVQGSGGCGPAHRRAHRRDHLDGVGARLRPQQSAFDASHPLQYGKFAIHDFHAQNRVLTVPEIFTYSSNIGTARMALSLGIEHHKAFLRKMGQLERLRTELPESAEPLVPRRWGELNTVTIAFGHGLSVAPLQAVSAIGALMNGGRLIPPTFLKRSEEDAAALAKQVIKPETSEKMRYLMRLNVEKGTATKADVKGYYIGGKTGTSDKVVGGRYSKTKVLTSFTAVLPADQPRYLLLIMLDEPQTTPETHGFTTSGWNAVPVGGAVIARIAPLLGIEPRFDLPSSDKLILASVGSR